MSITLLSDSGSHAGVIRQAAGLGVSCTTDASGNTLVVTAVADAKHKLELIVWRLEPSGSSVTRLADSGTQAGVIKLVDLAASTENRFISGVRTSDGILRLIAWHVNPATGSIQRLTDSGSASGVVSRIAMCPSPEANGNVLLAVRSKAGKLLLKNWGFDANGALKQFGDSATQGQPAGAISEAAVGALSGNKAFTAVIDGAGKLLVIVWQVLPNGHLQRLCDSGPHAGAVQSVSGVALGDMLVTAVRDGASNVMLISWRVSSDGATITRLSDSGHAAGGGDLISCQAIPLGGPAAGPVGRVFTALRTRENTLEVIAWEISSDGGIQRVEDLRDRPGTVDMIRFAPAQDLFVTAVRDADQKLKLVAWRMDARGSASETLADNLTVFSTSTWENTAQVVAPSPSAPKGTVVMQIGQSLAGAGFVWRDLLDSSGVVALQATETRVDNWLWPGQTNATDNQLIRLKDGSLMAIKNGYVSNNVLNPPFWFNTCAIKNQSSQQARNAVFVYRSTDAGHSWNQISYIDSAVDANGEFGWPQSDGNANGNGGVGGFDRTDLFQDPYTGQIYITGGGDGGPYQMNGTTVSNHAGVIFVSQDNGATWSELGRIPHQGKAGAPYTMTSTPTHPLVMFMILNGMPTLFHVNQGSNVLSAGQSVALLVDGEPLKAAFDPGIGDLRGAPPSVARVTASAAGNQVWIAYPTLNEHSRQIYKICLATLGAGGPRVEEVVTIQGQDPVNRCVALGQFVQYDLVDQQVTNPDNVTLFSWVDAAPASAADKQLMVRYKLLCNSVGQFQTGALSVSAGSPRSFFRLGIGDYFKGGTFAWNGKFNFLTVWAEPDADKANVVSVQP